MRRLCSLIVAVSFLPVFAIGQDPVSIKSREEIAAHVLSVHEILPIARPTDQGMPWLFVTVRVVVGPDGSVTSAKPAGGDQAFFSQAVDAAKQWRFVPFQRNGRAVAATFESSIMIVPPERRSTGVSPMPEVADWNSLRMTLTRSGCFGSCPAYELTVHGNGTVEYNGEQYTKLCGEWRGTVAMSVVHELFAQFRAADYFSLYSEYEWAATDLPTFTTSITFDKVGHQVLDYGGEQVGMPEAVRDLENSIDRMAGPNHWLTRHKVHPGTDNSCDSLVPTAPEKPLPDSIRKKHGQLKPGVAIGSALTITSKLNSQKLRQ